MVKAFKIQVRLIQQKTVSRLHAWDELIMTFAVVSLYHQIQATWTTSGYPAHRLSYISCTSSAMRCAAVPPSSRARPSIATRHGPLHHRPEPRVPPTSQNLHKLCRMHAAHTSVPCALTRFKVLKAPESPFQQPERMLDHDPGNGKCLIVVPFLNIVTCYWIFPEGGHEPWLELGCRVVHQESVGQLLTSISQIFP